MRAVKSNAKRQSLGLTIPVATRQARKIVDQVMPPGAGATVESRSSADPVTLERVIITTVTFPANTSDVQRISLTTGLGADDGRTLVVADSSITVTRKVAA